MSELMNKEAAASRLTEFGLLRHLADDIAHRDNLEEQVLFQGQGKILLALSQEDHLAQRTLAQRLNMTAQSTAEFVRKLEQKKLVSRAKLPTDRRVTIVSLTAKGRAQATKNNYDMPAFLDALDDVELQQLTQILDKIIASLYTEIQTADPSWFNKFHQGLMNRIIKKMHGDAPEPKTK